jgi:dipeptidyl-peptidase-4
LRARTQRFTLGLPRTISVCRDGRRVLFLRSAAGDDPRTGLWVLDLPDGDERQVVGPADDLDLPDAERARRERVREGAHGVVSYAADDAGRIAAFPVGGRLYVADIDAGTVRQLAAAEACFDPRPDPTGQRVAYVDGRDLRLTGIDGQDDRALAGEPDAAVFWGRAEFVAAEEMGRFRGFWWAPDGSRLLATRVDETPVSTWWISDPAYPDRAPTPVRYPAAGTANADVTLWAVGLDGSRLEVRWDRERYPYLGGVSWTAAGPPLLEVVSRDQRSVAVLSADPQSGETATLHEASDPKWVELFPGVPVWFGDAVARIVDRGEHRGLWVGGEPVTPLGLYVRDVAGVTDHGIVFHASGDDPSQIAVYRWSPDGVERLTPQPEVHRAVVGGTTLVVSSAGIDEPGTRTAVHHDGATRALTSHAITPPLRPRVRMMRLGSRELVAGLVLPRDHRPGTSLPVLLDPYGGPHHQHVMSTQGGWLEPQWIADQGFAVLVADGRGTPGRDPVWEREVYRDFAGPVLEDQIDALHAAAEQVSDLDLSRVAIRGWSFGGWLAALAVLRRPDVFAAAIAGAPVTDWSLYDTFYTERYLGTPQQDPDVYRHNSLLDDASALTRPLLLIHGLADDNVVAAHTLRLSMRLTEAGRPHVMMPLTGVTHMTPQEAVAENLLVVEMEFLKRHLSV